MTDLRIAPEGATRVIPQWAYDAALSKAGLTRAEVGDMELFHAFANFISQREDPPLWEEACQIIRQVYGPTEGCRGEGPHRVRTILNDIEGKDFWEARCVLAALRRGMELAQLTNQDSHHD